MTPLLFASDLDGTLLGADGQLTPGTIEALRAVRAMGADVVAVTGRSPLTALPRLQPHGVIDTALCNNGAIHVDVSTGEVLDATYLSTAELRSFFEALDDALPGVALAWETDEGFGENREFHALGLYLETSRVHSVDGLPDPAELRTTKLAVAHRDHDPIALAELLALRIESDLVMSTSGAPFLEATAPGVHKGAALAAWCAPRSIDRTAVVSYGDNHNDLTMLEWAGVGVAVENAHPLAHAAADTSIGHHRDDSVALDMLARSRPG